MADVPIIKYDVGSPTDEKLERIRRTTHGVDFVEAFLRSISIADYVTQTQAAGRKVLVEDVDGKYRELVLE